MKRLNPTETREIASVSELPTAEPNSKPILCAAEAPVTQEKLEFDYK